MRRKYRQQGSRTGRRHPPSLLIHSAKIQTIRQQYPIFFCLLGPADHPTIQRTWVAAIGGVINWTRFFFFSFFLLVSFQSGLLTETLFFFLAPSIFFFSR
ncbi:hypothetical protein V8C26DRAFT_390594 [Trichoderma gracile]